MIFVAHLACNYYGDTEKRAHFQLLQKQTNGRYFFFGKLQRNAAVKKSQDGIRLKMAMFFTRLVSATSSLCVQVMCNFFCNYSIQWHWNGWWLRRNCPPCLKHELRCSDCFLKTLPLMFFYLSSGNNIDLVKPLMEFCRIIDRETVWPRIYTNIPSVRISCTVKKEN